MAETLFIIPLIIGFIFILCISVYTIISTFTHYEKYGIKLTVILNLITILNACILYSSLYVISIIFFFSEVINILLWKLSILLGFISLMLISLIYSFLEHYRKIPYFPSLFFMIIFGFLIAAYFTPSSIQISLNSNIPPPFLILDISKINYTFNFMTGLIISIFQLSFIFYFFYLSFVIYKKARDKTAAKGLIINSLIFTLPVLCFIMYILFQLWIFRELYICTSWITMAIVCLRLVYNPEFFSELTSKIYYVNIYHKSGILLFSYKFKATNNQVDSSIWGNILIGINHILSEFVYTRDQIEVLQTKSSDIIVNYDSLGFAVVLITNRKNAILQKLMDNFLEEFRNKYKNELTEVQDLNKLINVSEFKETKEIIEKNFQMYL